MTLAALTLADGGQDSRPSDLADSDTVATYRETFREGPGRFEEFDDADLSAVHRDGAYHVTGKVADSTSWTTARIDRTRVVDASATVELIDARQGEAGLMVLTSGSEGYILSVDQDGLTTVGLSVDEEDFIIPLTYGEGGPVDGPVALRLTVTPTSDGTQLVGYVDGEEALRHLDRRAGWSSFREIGVVVGTFDEPVTMAADDIVVRTGR